jgi:hypothetical protein
MAFDDENGNPIYARNLDRNYVNSVINQRSGYFDFEEMFLINKKPARLVLWGYSNERGWCERKEETL